MGCRELEHFFENAAQPQRLFNIFWSEDSYALYALYALASYCIVLQTLRIVAGLQNGSVYASVVVVLVNSVHIYSDFRLRIPVQCTSVAERSKGR